MRSLGRSYCLARSLARPLALSLAVSCYGVTVAAQTAHDSAHAIPAHARADSIAALLNCLTGKKLPGNIAKACALNGRSLLAEVQLIVPPTPTPIPPTPVPSLSHPNEPNGFHQVAFQPFDSLNNVDFVCCLAGGQGISVAPDSTVPEGSKSSAFATYPAGFPSGIAPGGEYPRINPFTTKPRQVYISFWAKLSLNWVGNSAGLNKILYLQVDQTNRGSIEFVGMGGIDATNQTLAPMTVLEGVRVQVGDSVVSPSYTFVPNRVPYATSIAIQRGTWGHYEVLVTLNSAPGVLDGSLSWWWNGTLYGQFANVIDWSTTPTSSFTTAYWEPTYGGAGPPVPAAQQMYLKDLYISTP